MPMDPNQPIFLVVRNSDDPAEQARNMKKGMRSFLQQIAQVNAQNPLPKSAKPSNASPEHPPETTDKTSP